MYQISNVMPLLLTVLIFSGCHSDKKNNSGLPGIVSKTNFVQSDTSYVSIDGMWHCTDETALKFPNGKLEPIILIMGSNLNIPMVKGCFLWEGRFYDEWRLADYYYNDSINELILKDEDGSIYKAKVDRNYKLISGIIQSADSGDPHQLEFIREKTFKPEKFFFPRKPSSDGSIPYVYQQPESGQDNLHTASVFEFTSDTLAFNNLMKGIIRQKYGRLESLLILKDQKLIVEEYFYKHDRSTLHNIHSDTKSIISILFGIALDQHPEITIDQSIFDFFPDYDSLKRTDNREITLKHLLTMHAGLEEPKNVDERSVYDDILKYYLSLPMVSEPGREFRYCNACSNILGAVIHSLTGKQPDRFAKKVLFDPLGIKTYYWQAESGVPHCESDLYMIPRDEIKIGLLVLNNGAWNGKQIVSEKWITESTKARVRETKFFNYGYHWWHRSSKNVPWWKETEDLIDTELDKVIALGYGGQYIFIIRDLNMVVVTTASDYANGQNARSKVAMLVDEIEPMFRN